MTDHPSKLIAAYLDDRITEQQFAELCAWLQASPDHADQFAAHGLLETQLREQLAFDKLIEQAEVAPAASDLIDRATVPTVFEDGPAVAPSRPWTVRLARRIDWSRHPVAFGAAVVAVAIICWISFAALIGPDWRNPLGTAGGPDADDGVAARLVWVEPAQWGGEAPNGRGMAAGRELNLKAGRARLQFSSGAVVVLEGPATFTLGDRNTGRLSVGKLVAHVPKPAVGFVVETPKASVEDIGTQFAVDVDSKGETLVHVAVGRVRAQYAGSPDQVPRTIELAAGQSLRLDRVATVFETPAAERARFAVLTLNQKTKRGRTIAGVSVHAVSSELVGGPHHRAAVHAIDGSGLARRRHVNVPPDGTMWLTTGAYAEPHSKLPARIVFDLGEPYDLSHLQVWNYNESTNNLTSRGAKEVEISVSASADAADFTRLVRAGESSMFVFPRADGTPAYRGFPLDLRGIANPDVLNGVRYVRFDIKSPWGENPTEPSDVVGLSEVQFFGTGVEADPNGVVPNQKSN